MVPLTQHLVFVVDFRDLTLQFFSLTAFIFELSRQGCKFVFKNLDLLSHFLLIAFELIGRFVLLVIVHDSPELIFLLAQLVQSILLGSHALLELEVLFFALFQTFGIYPRFCLQFGQLAVDVDELVGQHLVIAK